MKLKKIASLALAGIMAVSMLAGCDAASSSSSENTAPATGLVGKVIENLSEDVTKKVTFTAGSDLQTTLNKMVAYYGSNKSTLSTDFTDTNLVKFDDDLEAAELPAVDATVVDKDDDAVSTAKVVTVNSSDANEDYVAKLIAAKIEDDYVMEGSTKLAGLPVKGNDLKSSSTVSTADCYYTFTYTGEIAVAEIDDVVSHNTVYVVAYTVTRTPAKNAL